MKSKICLLTFISILSAVTEKSFSQNYLSVFGNTSTTWDVILHGACDAICSQTYTVTGDTSILSNNYKVIPGLEGFVREDTIQGKAWFYNSFYGTEFLVMDLNLNPGDTFIVYHFTGTPEPFIVDSVYYVNSLKHVRLNAWVTMCAYNEQLTFIEGSGTNASFHYQRALNGSSVDSYMLCHHKNGIKVAGNILFNDICYVCEVGIDENNSGDNAIKIFPNPATGQLNIEAKDISSSQFTVTIYNVLGEEIIFQKANSLFLTVNISDLAEGVYYILAGDNSSKTHQRFIKQ